MSYKRQEDDDESQPFFPNSANAAFPSPPVEMRVMGVQQQPTFAQIPQGYYLPHAVDHQQFQQQQQQQQQQQYPQTFAPPPVQYPYEHNQHMQPPHPYPAPPAYYHAPPHPFPPPFPAEEPFVPADPNSRNEFFFATAGFILGFFLPIAWCSGWLFFRSPQRGTRTLARASLACICISVVALLLMVIIFVFAIGHMAPMAKCAMINAEIPANACSTCSAIQGCGWCPAANTCVPIMPNRPDNGRHNRQPPPPPLCEPSQLLRNPGQCPPPTPAQLPATPPSQFLDKP